ncbi:MAG: ROK family protein [Candidatus Gastranaerophilales bacterium]|nr:ROK family protein [Candidatus Gastranaerophilales bacterium]
MKKYRIGVDIGGTNIKIALVDFDGKIIYSNTVPTRAEMGYEAGVNNIKQAIKELMQETNQDAKTIEAIGFGLPGQIDYKEGIVKNLPNIPGWVNIPLAKMIEDEFSIPTKLDNDVRCAALGELNFGAGKGCENLICITVGTGIGSGIVLNGKLIRGASNAAGEIGHIKMDMTGGPLCGCGDYGCFEAYASGPAIVTMAREYISGGKSAKYKEMATDGIITPYIVAQAALQGDAVSIQIFKQMGKIIGIGLSSVINLLNPEKIIIGGGVADAGDLLLEPIRKTIADRAMPIQAAAVQVVPAQLANTAGVIGASLLINS